MKKYITRIIIYVGLLLCILLFLYGRTLWYPICTKICGRKTSADICENIGSKIERNLLLQCKQKGLKEIPKKICIIALKDEQILEIWTNDLNKNILITKYNFTAFSGGLGPKLKSGDRQIPEGIYEIEYLNPNSSYHLSMKINYPNEFDRESAKKDNRNYLGGDIFIHGKAVTIGCIPIGDKNIEELFVLVYKLGLKNVKVIIAPNDLRAGNPLYQNPEIIWLKQKYKLIKEELNQY